MSEKLHLNQTFSTNFSFSQQDVADFARVTGDNNPVHLDEGFASKTIFKTRIILQVFFRMLFLKYLRHILRLKLFLIFKDLFILFQNKN